MLSRECSHYGIVPPVHSLLRRLASALREVWSKAQNDKFQSLSLRLPPPPHIRVVLLIPRHIV